MDNIKVTQGDLLARDLRFALVAARFNDSIVENLVRGAIDALLRHGASEKQIELIRVPGAFDLPLIVRRAAASRRFDASSPWVPSSAERRHISTSWPGNAPQVSRVPPMKPEFPSPSAYLPRIPSSRRSSAPGPRPETRGSMPRWPLSSSPTCFGAWTSERAAARRPFLPRAQRVAQARDAGALPVAARRPERI